MDIRKLERHNAFVFPDEELNKKKERTIFIVSEIKNNKLYILGPEDLQGEVSLDKKIEVWKVVDNKFVS